MLGQPLAWLAEVSTCTYSHHIRLLMTIAMNSMCRRIYLISPMRRYVSQSIAYRCDSLGSTHVESCHPSGRTNASTLQPFRRSCMSFASDLSSRISTASDQVKPQEGQRSKTRLQSSGKSSTLTLLHYHWRALTKARSSAVPVMSQSEHQTPTFAWLPACSATLSVIYNPKHSSALFASANTDQSMPGSVSQPVAQNAMHRPASPRLHLLSVTAGVHSQHVHPLPSHTLPSSHTCCHPNTFPCCLSHEISSPNAGEVTLSGGVLGAYT
jgi:hypothetical protein